MSIELCPGALQNLDVEEKRKNVLVSALEKTT